MIGGICNTKDVKLSFIWGAVYGLLKIWRINPSGKQFIPQEELERMEHSHTP